MSDLILVKGLARSYRSGDRTINVLRGLDLAVGRGEMIAVVGESGAGKSTLLHLLGALDRPDGGSYLFEGTEVLGRSTEALASFRNTRIGFVFQFHHLLPEFSALENTMIAGLIGRMASAAARQKALGLLDDLGVAERAGHLPSQMSGGEQQRVAIARALMTAGSLLLADEPTGNLDAGTAARVFEVLRRVQRARGVSVVMATHNERLARECDRMLLLREGILVPVEAASDPPRQEMVRP